MSSDPVFADSYTRLKWTQDRLADERRVRRQLAEALWEVTADGFNLPCGHAEKCVVCAALAASDALDRENPS